MLTRLPATLVLLLTLGYLGLELPFSAHLLDIVGTTSDPATIHNTEIVGRLISGLAAALLFWGLVLIPRMYQLGIFMTPLLCLSSGVVITAGVYIGQAQLVDWLVESTTAEKRQTAFGVLMFTTQIQKDQADIRELPLGGEKLGTPEGKTFIAILPALAASQEDIRQRMLPSARSFAAIPVMQQIGSPSAFYNRAYVQALKDFHQQYLQYRKGVDDLNKGFDGVDREAEKAYVRFKKNMEKRLLHGPPPERYRNLIRRDVRNEGVPVPESWDCWSRGPFIKAATEEGYSEARQRFRQATIRAAGTALPPNLMRFEDFLKYPAIQKEWRGRIGLRKNVSLSLGVTQDEFERQVYRVLVAEAVDQQIARLDAGVQEFEEGGRYYDDGMRAIRGLIVPPIALAFSLIGALTHIVKSMVTIALVVAPQLSLTRQLFLAVFGLFCASMTVWIPNSLTQAPAYSRMMTAARDSMGWSPSFMLRWVIHTQPLLYPVNDSVRRWTEPHFSPYDSALVHLLEKLDPAPKDGVDDRKARAAQGGETAQAIPVLHQVVVAPQDADVETPGSNEPSSAPAAEPSLGSAPAIGVGLGALRLNGCPAAMRIDAHRGHRDYPENSVEGIVASFQEGADAVEIDIQRLRDGTWVLHHDPQLGRVVTGSGLVNQLSLAQWESLSMKDRKGRLIDISPATLKEVVEASESYLSRGQKLNVEFKGHFSCDQIEGAVQTMRAAGASGKSLTLTSVDASAVQCMNRLHEGYRAQIILDPRGASNGALTQRAARKLTALTSSPQLSIFAAKHQSPVGIHVSSSMVEDDPAILARVREHNLKIFIYSTNGRDAQMIDALSKALRLTGLLPDGAIIDGSVRGFCAELKGAAR